MSGSLAQQLIAKYLQDNNQQADAVNITRALNAASINPGLIPGLSVGGTGEYSPGDPRTGGLQPGNAPIAPPAQPVRRSVSAPTRPSAPSAPIGSDVDFLGNRIIAGLPPTGTPRDKNELGGSVPQGPAQQPMPQQARRGAQAASSRPQPTLQPAQPAQPEQPNPLVDRLGRRRQFAYNPPVPTAAEDALQGQRVAPLGSVAPNADGDPDQLMTAMDKAMMSAGNQSMLPNEAMLAQQRSPIAPGGSLPSEDVLAQQRSGVAPAEVVDTMPVPNPRPGMTLTRGDAAPPSGMLPLQGEPQPGSQPVRTASRPSSAYAPDRGGAPNAMIAPPPPPASIHPLNVQDPANLAALIAGLGVGGAGLSAMLASGGDGSGTPRPTAQNQGARRTRAPSVAQQIVAGVGPTLPNTNMSTQGADLLNSGARTFTQPQVQAPRVQPAPQLAPTPQPAPQPQPTPTPQPQAATKTPGGTKAPTPVAERSFNEPGFMDRILGRVSVPPVVALGSTLVPEQPVVEVGQTKAPTPQPQPTPTPRQTAMTSAPRAGPQMAPNVQVPIAVGNLNDPNNVATMQARMSLLEALRRSMRINRSTPFAPPTGQPAGPMGAALSTSGIGGPGGDPGLAIRNALTGQGVGRMMLQ